MAVIKIATFANINIVIYKKECWQKNSYSAAVFHCLQLGPNTVFLV